MTAQELKNSILQLAVQGKLVPQYKEDEPASELLKRIEQEKSTLIKAGIIKKYKELSTLSADDCPFDIPESWIWMKLGDMCQLLDGVKRRGEKHPDRRGGDSGSDNRIQPGNARRRRRGAARRTF